MYPIKINSQINFVKSSYYVIFTVNKFEVKTKYIPKHSLFDDVKIT